MTSALLLLLLLLLLLPGVVSLSPPHLRFLLSLYSNSSVSVLAPSVYCPTHLPRLTPSPLTAASSVCGPGADRYRICQCCTPVYTFFLAAIVASLQPPMGDELTRTFGSHNKRAQKWHCLDIPFHLYTDSRDFSTIQFFVFFFPFTSMCTLHVWMPAVHGHMCAFAVCRRDPVRRVCVAVYTVRECGCVCNLHSRLSQPFCRKKKKKNISDLYQSQTEQPQFFSVRAVNIWPAA